MSGEKSRGYDTFGNIVIVKFKREEKAREKKKWAESFLKEHKNVRSVLEKVSKFKGRLRVQKTKYIAGENTQEALYRENGCEFRLNVNSCYFSPRLAAERKEIAGMVKKGEKVLVLFGGVAPFAIVIAKAKKAGRVVSIEIGKECSKYALENVKRNKVNVEIVQGDVRRQIPKIHEEFNRVVMARPNLKDSFLDISLPKVLKGGIVHYYGFCREDELGEMKNMVLREAEKVGRKIKILRVKKAGDIGVRTYRYRIDLKVIS